MAFNPLYFSDFIMSAAKIDPWNATMNEIGEQAIAGREESKERSGRKNGIGNKMKINRYLE